jgi:hypothetical protein
MAGKAAPVLTGCHPVSIPAMAANDAQHDRCGLAALLLATLWALPVRAQDPCAAFSWDVAHERSLFSAPAQSLTAAAAPDKPPALSPDTLYQLKLLEQSKVTFAAAPGRKAPAEGAYAGLARLTLQSAGVYRISLDGPLWVDVLAGGVAIASKDFQGRPGCDAPHKIVEFVLPAGTPLTLQFSAGSQDRLKVSVTRSPAQ